MSQLADKPEALERLTVEYLQRLSVDANIIPEGIPNYFEVTSGFHYVQTCGAAFLTSSVTQLPNSPKFSRNIAASFAAAAS